VSAPPRVRRPEQRREEILEAALEQFSERGYHATAVADIASELHMSHGTFYRYFNSKRDILEQMVDRAAGRIVEVADADTAGPASTPEQFRDRLEQILTAIVLIVHDDPRLARLLLFEATGVDDALTFRILNEVDDLRLVTAAYLRHGVQQGFLAADLDVTETARALNGVAFAGALRAVREPGDAAGYVRAAVRLIFDGIGAT
jgi:AcrR family transcriptional regulator